MSDYENKHGITILIDTLNSGDFNLIIDFNQPIENTCKAFAVVLSMIERGKIYEYILDKLKEYISKDNKDINAIIDLILENKKIIDNNLDTPAVLPRDVFKRISSGV